MKPLMIILLVSVVGHAQHIADAARVERQRQAKVASLRVFTPESARAFLPPVPPDPVLPAVSGNPADPSAAAAPTADGASTTPAAAPAAEPPAAPAPQAATPPSSTSADLLRKYNEEVARTRAKIQELQDLEVTLQLDVNNLTNQFFAPKNNEAARRTAQDAIGRKQSELTATRAELEQTRRQLMLLETQGPPRQQ